MKDLVIIENAIKDAYISVVPAKFKKEKQYKSFTRAVAIYLVLKSEKTDFEIPVSKRDVKNLAEDFTNPSTGNPLGKSSLYQMLKTGKSGEKAISIYDSSQLQKKFPLDYKYALTLFTEK